MSLESLSVAESSFRSTAELGGSVLTVKLEGEASLDAIALLKQVLDGAHLEAVARKVTEIAVDLTGLEFLNSSGIKHFVTWLQLASQIPESEGYRIRLISNPKLAWQRRSLETLRCFAPHLVSVDTRT